MQLTLLKSKLHRATVTQSNLHYEGSITVDPALLELSNILPNEQVDVLNITNGERFTTYAIEANNPNFGEICINGAAARLVQKGDLVIICAYARMDEGEAMRHKPTVILLDERNQVKTEERKEPPSRAKPRQTKAKRKRNNAAEPFTPFLMLENKALQTTEIEEKLSSKAETSDDKNAEKAKRSKDKYITAERREALDALKSKSNRIRYLASEGFSNANIARALDIRYQFVRNVLVQDEKNPDRARRKN